MNKDLEFLQGIFETLINFFKMIIALFTGGIPDGDNDGDDNEED